VSRLFPLALMIALASGGWYVLNNPNAANNLANLRQYIPQAAGQIGQGQFGQAGGYQAPYPSALPAAQIPAQYASSQPAPPSPLLGGPAIRIASFNIQVFGDSKGSKPYIMQTLATIIQNFQVVAIQEIRTQDDYFIDNFLRNYVNKNGRMYDKVIGPRLGRSNSKEQYAFIYDTAAIEVNPRMTYTVNDPDDLLHREPLVAMFRVRGLPPQEAFTFVLINIHTDPDETDTELDALGQVYQVVRRNSGGEDDIILLGDLNVDDQHLGQLGQLEGVRPVIRSTFTNTRQNAQYDNIVLHQPSTAEYTGRSAVFDYQKQFGLTIDQALQVSDHFPIWAEFSAYESAAPGRVANRPGELRAQ
jgi:deoxyribonuclease-1-like protein